MPLLDIRTETYFNNVNTPTHFKVELAPANDDIFPAFDRSSYIFDCILGPLNIPTSTFPDFVTATTFFASEYAAVIVSSVNNFMGTNYTLGKIYPFMKKFEFDTFSGKQNLIPIAENISSSATDAATNAPINLNIVTTLLGALVGEVNNANNRHNSLAIKYNDLANRFNTLISHLETQKLQDVR